MKVTTLEFKRPILIIDDFLPEGAAEEVLQECIDLRPIYQPALVMNENNEDVRRPKFRENDVVYLDNVFRNNVANSKIFRNMLNSGSADALAIFNDKPEHGLFCDEARKLWKESGIFDIINLSTRSETIVSRYGNCDFYGLHTDPNNNPANRLVTCVYYVNKRPEQFEGGDITFKDKDISATAHPVHNRLVVFPAHTLHQVQKVRLKDDQFENGRFSLNIWLGFNM